MTFDYNGNKTALINMIKYILKTTHWLSHLLHQMICNEILKVLIQR